MELSQYNSNNSNEILSDISIDGTFENIPSNFQLISENYKQQLFSIILTD
jgi:hypothetical protein